MAEQIQQFETVHGNISQDLNDTTEARIHESLFLLSVGSNDIFEFFDSLSKSNSGNVTLKVLEFMTNLMNQYQAHLQVCLISFLITKYVRTYNPYFPSIFCYMMCRIYSNLELENLAF